MNGLELIKSRRTVRKFKPEPVPDNIIEKILEAGIWTPSHKNSQPWEFAIIGPQTRSRLNQLYHSVMEAVLNDPELPPPARAGILSLMDDFGGATFMAAVLSRPAQDQLESVENPITVGAAAHNMCLAAWEQGIGSVWLSIGGHPLAREILKLKEGYQAVAVLAMGYPETVPPAPPREPYQARLSQLP